MLVAGAGANCEMIPRISRCSYTRESCTRPGPPDKGRCLWEHHYYDPATPRAGGGKVPTLGYFRSLFYYSALYKIFSGGVPPVISASRMDGIHAGGPPMSTWRSAHVP